MFSCLLTLHDNVLGDMRRKRKTRYSCRTVHSHTYSACASNDCSVRNVLPMKNYIIITGGESILLYLVKPSIKFALKPERKLRGCKPR